MKKLAIALGSAVLFVTTAYAAQHKSPFGFSVDMPSDWTVLSQQELKDNPDLFNTNDPKFKGMDPGLLQQVVDKIRTGGMEIYYHTGFGANGFSDNVNVIKTVSKLPSTSDELKDTCKDLPGQFSQYFGHPISMYQCSLTKVGGSDAMLLEFDGALPGTRSIQYQVQKSENIILVVTGTFSDATLDKERGLFTSIVMSMHLN